jgi:hypothetical protein
MAAISDTDNVIAALEQSSRVCQLILTDLIDWDFEEILAAMEVPFPELTDLRFSSFTSDDETPAIPDSFLGGSAPRLRHFQLNGIPFPGLPALLLSATHLVSLRLGSILYPEHISPEAMAALLSALVNLRTLSLGFESPESLPDWESPSPPPPKRSILPALKHFQFIGVPEYLEDLVTMIDAPQLHRFVICLFHQTNLDTQRLAEFINRTPKLCKWDKAYVQFDDKVYNVGVQFGTLGIYIQRVNRNQRLSSVAQVCNSALPSLVSTVEHLYIQRGGFTSMPLVWQNNAAENTLWLQLLLPFTAVKNLYLSEELGPSIVDALEQLVGARITEVLPNLQNIFVEYFKPSRPSRFQKEVGQFVAARQLSNHPIAISEWREVKPVPDIDYESYDNDSDKESIL